MIWYQWQKEKSIEVSGALVLCTELSKPSLNACCHCFVYLACTKVCLSQAPVFPVKSLRFVNWCFTVELAGIAMDIDPKLSGGKTTTRNAGSNAVHHLHQFG